MDPKSRGMTRFVKNPGMGPMARATGKRYVTLICIVGGVFLMFYRESREEKGEGDEMDIDSNQGLREADQPQAKRQKTGDE